jgi:hypothetical protein
MRGEGRTVLAAGRAEILQRILGEAVSRIASEGLLPDVDPRTPAASGEKAVEGSGLGEGVGAGQTGQNGPAALRFCNLVAQGSSDAEGGRAIETASLMLGSDRERGYCLEMICADFLAGASLNHGDPEMLLFSMTRFFKFLPEEQR